MVDIPRPADMAERRKRVRKVRLLGVLMMLPVLVALSVVIGPTGLFYALMVLGGLALIVAAIFGFLLALDVDGLANSIARDWQKRKES